MIFEVIFWVLLGIIIYSYLGYVVLMGVLYVFVKLFKHDNKRILDDEPEVTLFIAAYNERDFVSQKIENSKSLNYPPEKLKILFVTDGSDDGTPEMVKEHKEVLLYHEPERNGKIGAINRGMDFVDTPIVVFSDCNTMLSENAIREIVEHFTNPEVGCVAGEKRITRKSKDIAVNAGEGIYWKYESMLKKFEATVNSTVGAAGELFAIRKELFEPVEKDTLLDDFMISLRIAQKGYRIKYTAKAFAIENASVNIREEMKRKIRIASGGAQSMFRLNSLFNMFKHGLLSFQYISHKVLRWTIIPFSIPLLFFINMYLYFISEHLIYDILFYLQLVFYLFVLIGWLLEEKKTPFKFIFIPFYLFIMNLCIYMGVIKYVNGKQSHKWERAKRGFG